MELNPYSEWLAIPPSQTPPTHYRLLGVREFENDFDKIHKAALDQIARLRIHQAGEHLDLTQKLMNEVALARVVLCDPVKKSEYDRVLRGGKDHSPATASPVPSVPTFLKNGDSEEHAEPSDEFEDIVDAELDEPTSPYGPQPLRGPLRTVVRAAIGTVVVLGLMAAGLLAWTFLPKTEFFSPSYPEPPKEVVIIPAPSEPPPTQPPTPAPPAPTPSPPTPPQSTPTPSPLTPSPAPIAPTPAPPVVAMASIDPLDGFQIVWESKFADHPAGMARPIDQPHAISPEGMTLSARAPGRQAVYFPAPAGDFRFLVQVRRTDLPSEGDRFLVGALDAGSKTVGAVLRIVDGQRLVFAQAGGGEGSTGVSIAADGPIWLDIRRSKDDWSISVIDETGKPTSTAPLKSSIKPVALIMALESRAAASAKSTIAQARIEATDDAMNSRIGDWPRLLQPPTGASQNSLFRAAVEASGRAMSLHYDFEDASEADAWGGTLESGDAGVVRLLPGAKTDFGPICRIRSIEFKAPFLERSTRISIEFDDGPGIEINAETAEARIGGKVVARFDPKGDKPIRIVLYDTDEKGTLTDESANQLVGEVPIGRASLKVDAGEVHLDDFKITGDFDYEPIWLSRLGAGDVGGVVGSYAITRRLYQWPGAFAIRGGEVRPVELANTPADETFPYLSPSGRDLYFARNADGGARRLFCVRRSMPTEWFDIEARLIGPREDASVLAASLDEDEKSAFVVAEAASGVGVYRCTRESLEKTFGEPQRQGVITDAKEGANPAILSNGLRLFFSKRDQRGWQLFETVRASADDKFGPARPAGLERGFRRPTLTSDQLTMYVEGPSEGDKSAIFRFTRKAADDAWGKPVRVPGLDPSTSKTGDFAPFVTPDGNLLYFASDRDGGVGGLDLYVTRIDKSPPKPDQSAPTGGTGAWLVLGPIEIKESDRDKPLNNLKKYFARPDRKNPPQAGTLINGVPWRRADALSNGSGIYLVAYPFRIGRSVSGVIKVASCPGGALFWLDGSDVKFNNLVGLGQKEPWRELGADPINIVSNEVRVTKGEHCLYGLVCVPQPSEGKLIIQFLESKSGETPGDIEPIVD